MGRKEGKSQERASGGDPSGGCGEENRPRRPPSERWLLTRKTWRYMADAGKRLIPEGVSGERPEDIPRIKEHFARMCRKEPRFLLWRKASFPGATPAARSGGRARGRRGGKEGRAGSEEPPALAALIEGTEHAAVLGIPGSAEMAVDGRSPLNAAPSSSSSPTPAHYYSAGPAAPEEEVITRRKTVVDRWVQTEPMPESVMKKIEEAAAEAFGKEPPKKDAADATKETDPKGSRRGSCPRDDLSPSVGDTIMRYLRMARKKSVDDKSEKFRTVNYDRVTAKASDGQGPKAEEDVGSGRGGEGVQSTQSWLPVLKTLGTAGLASESSGAAGAEVCGMVEREITVTTFRPLTSAPVAIPAAHSSSSPPSSTSTAPGSPPPFFSPVTSPPGRGRGPQHHQQPSSFLAQLLHSLQHHHRHSAPSSPVLSPPGGGGASSPPPTAAGSLPALLLPAAAAAAAAPGAPPVAVMQKSKSSSSVVASLAGRGPGGLVAKRIWRPRSRSTQGRTSPTATAPPPASAWIPQGSCRWNCVDTNRQVSLGDTNILMLTEVERRVLQKVALAKLQALNLGASVRIPSGEEAVTVAKPRRRPYLLRRKARTTTSPLDGGGRRSGDASCGSGLVFGIPISQCIENETATGRGSGRDSGGSSGRSSAGSLSECTTSPPSPRRDSSEERPREAGPEWRWSDGWPAEGAAQPRPKVPQLVLACLQHIKEHGLHTLGIFRVGSSKKRVRQLREDIDMGKDTDLSASQCPHDVAALLKEYFRDLPEPLLCRELYPAFVRTQAIRNRRLQFEALQHLVQLLPPEHRDTLCLLLDFLALVARNSEDKRDPHSGEWLTGNKMDSGNLATLFAPNILRKSNADFRCDSRDEAAEDRLDVINAVRCMIEHNRELFMVPAELLDEVYVHMMDTHPEALDDLLRSRCSPSTDEIWEDHILTDGVELQAAVHGTPPRRRVWSREEFLHGTAGMGGPDLGMMPRHRSRDGKGSKKRTKDPSAEPATPRGVGKEERPRVLTLSSDARTAAGAVGEMTTSSGCDGSGEADPETPDSERGVITGSLRIPVPAHVALEDIPFIEDGASEMSRGATPSRTASSPPSPSNPLPPGGGTPEVPPPLPATAEASSLDVIRAETLAPQEHPSDNQTAIISSPEEEAMADAQKRGAIRSMSTTDMSRRQRPSTGRGEAEVERRSSARRRYTEGRHTAAALPEVASPRGPVWKRREIIASEPRRRAAQ